MLDCFSLALQWRLLPSEFKGADVDAAAWKACAKVRVACVDRWRAELQAEVVGSAIHEQWVSFRGINLFCRIRGLELSKRKPVCRREHRSSSICAIEEVVIAIDRARRLCQTERVAIRAVEDVVPQHERRLTAVTNVECF